LMAVRNSGWSSATMTVSAWMASNRFMSFCHFPP
jgi:hypothetical protein